jgi:hypothetical protein
VGCRAARSDDRNARRRTRAGDRRRHRRTHGQLRACLADGSQRGHRWRRHGPPRARTDVRTEDGRMRTVALIPAHNEAERIASTLEALVSVPGIDEIIVVDDASTDDTAKIALQRHATVVRLERNLGKGGALETGAAAAGDPDVLVLLDGDLGATASQAGTLLAPVVEGTADMSIARFPKAVRQGRIRTREGPRPVGHPTTGRAVRCTSATFWSESPHPERPRGLQAVRGRLRCRGRAHRARTEGGPAGGGGRNHDGARLHRAGPRRVRTPWTPVQPRRPGAGAPRPGTSALDAAIRAREPEPRRLCRSSRWPDRQAPRSWRTPLRACRCGRLLTGPPRVPQPQHL